MNNIINRFKPYLTTILNNKKYLYIAVIVVSIVAAIFFTSSSDQIQIEETGEDISSNSKQDDSNEASSQSIFIDISGEVNKPGVYEMESDSRVFQAINKAGGLTKKACLDNINQAEILTDGQKIIIPTKGQKNQSLNAEKAESDLININSADSSKLQEINGIGPATAQKIIDYRTQNGNFSKIEDLKNVNGIGDKTFQKILPYICI